MKREDFHFDLPETLIAQAPLADRSASRLLVLDGASGATTHSAFRKLGASLRPGDLLVFNDTRVIPARLFGRKDTGGEVEVLVERVLAAGEVLAQVRASKRPRPGRKILFDDAVGTTVSATVRAEEEGGFLLASSSAAWASITSRQRVTNVVPPSADSKCAW